MPHSETAKAQSGWRDAVARLATLLGSARHVCVLTGAGVSAESGVPTFREAQSGLWARYDPLQLATPEAFEANPELVWDWYRYRRELVESVQPNAGHYALAELGGLIPEFTLVTQNVDGLHARAGSRDVIEFHGNLFINRCFRENVVVDGRPLDDYPSCPNCGSPLRPGVVWFGEAIPETALDRAFGAARDCDVLLAVGTSAGVYPAAGLIDVARETGSAVAEINPIPAAANVDIAVAGPSGEVLPAIVDRLLSIDQEPPHP